MENAGWIVGDGKSIKVWTDPWLDCTRKATPIGPPPEYAASLLVADLFTQNSTEWDTGKIRGLFPHLESQIRSIKPSYSGAPDKLAWLHSKTGEYSIKSGYWAAINGRPDSALTVSAPAINWKQSVWNLQTAPKIHMFIWRALQNVLPVGERLLARHIEINPKCKRCGAIESVDHLFLHCSYAQEVWDHAPFAIGFDSRRSTDLPSSWKLIASRVSLPPTGVGPGSLAPWILWTLWLARNNLLFSNKDTPARETLSKAICLAREWNSAQCRDQIKLRFPIPVFPCNPREVTVQSDAAWQNLTRNAGLGWTISSAGQTSKYSSSCRFVSSALAAEALSLREAVLLSTSRGFHRIVFESDSSQLIRAVNSGPVPSEIYGIVADIIAAISSCQSVSFVWIPRARNLLSDSLAKQALCSAELMSI
ncbi:hypothetical protein Bca101_063023 [Brassica carinata]